MKKEEIHFGDINRWLFGETPPEFMLEIVVRSILIYLVLLFVVRMMGKRMSGQITLTELAIMITLGAIVSPVMQLPDRGILFGVIVLFVALGFQRLFTLWGFKSKKVEEVTQGTMSLLIKDGVIDVEELHKTYITRQQLFAMLREKKIQNLGKVKRGYLEACGIFSVYQTEEVKAGLPLYPSSDAAIKELQQEVGDGMKACCNCGMMQHVDDKMTKCQNCKAVEWSQAYISTM